MTQEDKQLLLRDLCMRLPYKVVVKSLGEIKTIGLWDLKDVDNLPLPYLRPMLNMTKEELREYNELYAERENNNEFDDIKQYSDLICWLLKNHFDFIGLISKGLAIEVTKENNPYEQNKF